MLDQKKNIILIIIFFIILLSIISALIIEHTLGHQPCNLCLYERIPYFLSALLIIKIFFFKKYEKITLLILFLVFMISALLAFYHFGIEQGFFDESFVLSPIWSDSLSSACSDFFSKFSFSIFGFKFSFFSISSYMVRKTVISRCWQKKF